MKIMYCGTLQWGTTSLARMEALQELRHSVYGFDKRRFIREWGFGKNLVDWAQQRLCIGPNIWNLQKQLVLEAEVYKPDLLWIDQGSEINRDTIQKIKRRTNTTCVHYTPDSIKAPGMLTRLLYNAIPSYDTCITTKAHEVDQYNSIGARAVLYSQKGFSPRIHRPTKILASEYKTYNVDIVFIGQYQSERAEYLASLAESLPYALKIWGRGWGRGKTGKVLSRLSAGWAHGDVYAKALSGAKVGLGFLNVKVGDKYTSRTFEIPACRCFMLAQRTYEQQEFFIEGKEAEYFSTIPEMLEKLDYYLKNLKKRKIIASNGYKRALHSGYTWKDRMRCILEDIF